MMPFHRTCDRLYPSGRPVGLDEEERYKAARADWIRVLDAQSRISRAMDGCYFFECGCPDRPQGRWETTWSP